MTILILGQFTSLSMDEECDKHLQSRSSFKLQVTGNMLHRADCLWSSSVSGTGQCMLKSVFNFTRFY